MENVFNKYNLLTSASCNEEQYPYLEYEQQSLMIIFLNY